MKIDLSVRIIGMKCTYKVYEYTFFMPAQTLNNRELIN